MPAEEPRQALNDLRGHFSTRVIRDYLIMSYQALSEDRKTIRERGWPEPQAAQPHIASPDVIIDEGNRRFLMFYHGLEYGKRQLSRVAESTDGINFEPLQGTIPSPHLRSFVHDGNWYLLGMPGVLFRAADSDGPCEPRSSLLFEPRMRNELRDPFVFRDADGKLYLYYAARGEKALGVVQLEL